MNNMQQPDIVTVRQHLESADEHWFIQREEVGDYASLALARNLASSCCLEVGSKRVIAAPLFIPVTIVAGHAFEPQFDVAGLAGLMAGLHGDQVQTELFPEIKSASQVQAMNVIEAWSYAQEVVTSSLDGHAMYGYHAFDPFGDVRKIGNVYLHTALVAGWVRIADDRLMEGAKLAQLDYTAKCSVSNLIATDISLRTGDMPHCVMVGDVGAYAVVDQMLSEVNSYATMQAMAMQGMKCEIEPALAVESAPWRFFRLKDPNGEVISIVEVPADRQGAFARQVQYLSSLYELDWRIVMPSRFQHWH